MMKRITISGRLEGARVIGDMSIPEYWADEHGRPHTRMILFKNPDRIMVMMEGSLVGFHSPKAYLRNFLSEREEAKYHPIYINRELEIARRVLAPYDLSSRLPEPFTKDEIKEIREEGREPIR